MDRSGEVESLVLACYESWRTGDIAVFESLLSERRDGAHGRDGSGGMVVGAKRCH